MNISDNFIKLVAIFENDYLWQKIIEFIQIQSDFVMKYDILFCRASYAFFQFTKKVGYIRVVDFQVYKIIIQSYSSDLKMLLKYVVRYSFTSLYLPFTFDLRYGGIYCKVYTLRQYIFKYIPINVTSLQKYTSSHATFKFCVNNSYQHSFYILYIHLEHLQIIFSRNL